MNKLSDWYYIAREIIAFKLSPIRCFLFGHKMYIAPSWDWSEPDYCQYCMRIDEDCFTTIPCYLNRLYCWLVERDWQWFNRFDEWMLANIGNRLPKWWEY